MTQSVLVGIKDSDGGRAASLMGGWLSERLGLELVLAHVCGDPLPSPVGNAEHRTRMQHASTRRAKALLESIGPTAARRRIGSGKPAPVLAELAREEDAALIVVASRGRSRFARALFGSVSAELSVRAPCPVMVVPPGAELHLAAAGVADSRHPAEPG